MCKLCKGSETKNTCYKALKSWQKLDRYHLKAADTTYVLKRLFKSVAAVLSTISLKTPIRAAIAFKKLEKSLKADPILKDRFLYILISLQPLQTIASKKQENVQRTNPLMHGFELHQKI